MFKSIPIDPALLRDAGLTRIGFWPAGPQGDLAAGLERLREVAMHVPVALLRLQGGQVRGVVRRELTPTELSEAHLIPGTTCYGAAFMHEQDGVRTDYLLLVSRTEVTPPALHARSTARTESRPNRAARRLERFGPPHPLGEPIQPTTAPERSAG